MTIFKRNNKWYVQVMHKRIYHTPGRGFSDPLEAQDFSKNYKEALKKVMQENYLIPIHKKLCLEHYSNGKVQCACCHEKHPAFLTLDHIEGGGYKHRKKIGGGNKLYRYLVKNNFPEEIKLQVLCWNCNCGGKINHGFCPHQI